MHKIDNSVKFTLSEATSELYVMQDRIVAIVLIDSYPKLQYNSRSNV